MSKPVKKINRGGSDCVQLGVQKNLNYYGVRSKQFRIQTSTTISKQVKKFNKLQKEEQLCAFIKATKGFSY